MIVPMKKVTVVVQTADKVDMLKQLRKLGVLHIYDEKVKSVKGEELEKEYSAYKSVLQSLTERLPKKKSAPVSENLDKRALIANKKKLVQLLEKSKELKDQISKDSQLIDQIAGWGDFDPEAVRKLKREGIELHFYTMSAKEFAKMESEIEYISLDPIGKLVAFAVIGSPLDQSIPATKLDLPELGISQLQERIARSQKEQATIEAELTDNTKFISNYERHIRVLESDLRFEGIKSQMEGGEQLSYVSGFMPEPKSDAFTQAAKKNSWGYLIEEPADDELPPTLIKYPKGVGIIKPLFDILGTVPNYREGEVSTWFLMFFTLFFAMIIGDAGYGCIFLGVTIGLHAKTKKASDGVRLLYVLSLATIIWGTISGTWFGSDAIVQNTFLKYLVYQPITEQNNIMQFCFILGTIQLSLAEVISISRKVKAKDITAIAEVGWLMDVLTLYFIVLSLVISTECDYNKAFTVIGIGFVLVVLFGSQEKGKSFGKGILAGVAGLFTTFLDTISCFSNLMSYIRLFAVGMATVAIAQSFNSMASGVINSLGKKGIIVAVLILALGHGLNLMMGLLSVFVHGVRLNLLEFSGQIGMEWSGIAYEPFEETVKLK